MIKEKNGNITIDVTEVQLIKSMALLQDLIKYLENLKNKEELMEAVKTAHDASMAFYMEHFQGEALSNSEKPNKWIPVETALPKVGSEVLVCFDFKGKKSVYISHLFGDGKFHGLDDEYLTSEGRKHRKAVAWMPLPEPFDDNIK